MAINDAHVPSADAANLPRRRAVLRLLTFATCFAGLFVIAALTSWMLCNFSTRADPEPGPLQHVEQPPLKKIDRSGTAADLLQRGDDALLQFRPKIAIDYYEAFLEQDPSTAPFIHYRVALCFESMHRHDNALAHFRTAIQANATRPLTFACHLGLARCFLRQAHPANVRRIFVPILMDEARYRDIPSPMLAEAYHLVALSLAQQSFPTRSNELSLDSFLPYLAVELEPANYFDEISKHKLSPLQTTVGITSSKMVLQKHAAFDATILLNLTQTEKNSKDVLDRVITEAGFQSEWTPAAAKNMEDRNFHLSVSHRNLIEVIELLADHCDVTIECKGNVIRFASISETDAKQYRPQHQQMAKRSLLRALQFDASHPRTPALHLELGNNEATSGNAKEATKCYESVLTIHPASDYALIAGYNLAHMHLRNKDAIQARAAFYNVIYRAPGHELALKSQLRIGRLFLEEEKQHQALAPLRSAHILGAKSATQPMTILTLAACHFRMGEYDKTRAIIAKEREQLKKQPYSATSTFLDAYAQYEQAKITDAHRRESAELLNALWNQSEMDVLGPLGYLLFSQAYADLGFYDQAERMLRKGALDSHTPLNDCLQFHLGLLLMNKQEYKEVRQIYSSIAERSATYRKQAGHQLASLDLLENRFNECARRCDSLWKDPPTADPVELLRIWGTAYERLGDLKKAAQCFSGIAPD